ncbi:hypothetical protein SAMN05878276_0413 [Aquipseudomonas alcaligenes]|uniref:hypothetical protein n=1 Tax=Aquipseudomonas alcaligenes TaxID=43263 RepID=UPI000957185E|nr:hypothetical protein [Pseudomonas alcaligenes]SIR82557.1 hypothetical protein SAMN05878276_0413 [Pseudomonas alcaligenes]
MSLPRVMLGGVEIVVHAGVPEQADAPVVAETIIRMGQGGGVKLTHFRKAGGTISGQGWMPPGLDGLDYGQPLELRLTKQQSITQASHLGITLTSTPRPDMAPWAQALVGRDWVPTPMSLSGLAATVVPLPGAKMYSVQWMPRYWVFAQRPVQQMNPGDPSRPHSWSIPWEEV